MASVQKRQTKDGREFYEIIVRNGTARPSTRWYPPSGWSQKSIDREIAKVSAEFERQVKAGEIVTRREQKLIEIEQQQQAAEIKTLRQYAESVFMPALTVRCSENTRSNYQGNLDKWIYPALGDIKLPEITPVQIEALFLSMQSQLKAHSTVVKIYTILKGIFKKAYKADIIDRNPMDKVDRPKPRKDEIQANTPDSHTIEEIKHIQQCLQNEPLKWKTMIYLLIDTGMRRGECCGLEWTDFDFENNRVTIHRTLCYTAEKGVYIDTLKNRKVHSFDLAPIVIALLKEWRVEQSLSAISKYVFTQNGSPEPMHPQSPTRYLARFAKRYNLPHMKPHKLRHSFASIAITNHADIASVSEKLGHSDKAVTLRMYTHASEESIKGAGDIFRRAIGTIEPDAVTVSVTVSEETAANSVTKQA